MTHTTAYAIALQSPTGRITKRHEGTRDEMRFVLEAEGILRSSALRLLDSLPGVGDQASVYRSEGRRGKALITRLS